MFALEKLSNIQTTNKSYICLGLDLDPKKMPPDYSKSIKQMYEFAMKIVDATKDVVCAYKPNMAFFEAHGHEGLSLLESICNRIPDDIPIILDGKRGDIGNTASFYADAMYNRMRADWVTLNPYMGYDALRPFLEHKDKGIFVLCLTSNSGSKDFQLLDVEGKPLYKIVAEKVDYWNKEDNCGLVVGATQPEQLKEIRELSHNMPILIPGVGAQGGSLEKAILYGTDEFKKVAVINVSRSVLYASNGDDFAEKARAEVERLNTLTERLRKGERNIEADQSKPSEDSQKQAQSEPQQQSNDSKPEETKQSQASVVINKPTEPTPSQPSQSQPESKPIEEKKREPESQPNETEQKPQAAPMPTPPPPPPIPPTPEPKPQAQPQPQSQPEPEKPKEDPPKEEQQKKEPPPMPKPPPPLPPVPEIPRFDKPKSDNNQQNNQNQNQNRDHNNRDRRDFSNNNRGDKKFGHNNNRHNNNRRFNDNDRNRNRNDSNK